MRPPHFRSIRNIFIAIAMAGAVTISACSGQPQTRREKGTFSESAIGASHSKRRGPAGKPLGPSHIVTSSWYGPGYDGHQTASGERFNPRGLTAASKTLPLGSKVRATNLQNGRSVDLRINDRGPVAPGRSLDLSPAAAQKIGMTKSGVARLKITPLRGPSRPSSSSDKVTIRD
jgi:rare lipoprotein A (peptidoglycan hydrolase)